MPHGSTGFCLCRCHHAPPNTVLLSVTSFWTISTRPCSRPDTQLDASSIQAEGQPAGACCPSPLFLAASAPLGVLGSLSEATPLCILQRTHTKITGALSHSRSLCLALFSFFQSCFLPRCWCAFEFYPEHLILPDSQLLSLGGLIMPDPTLPYDIFFSQRLNSVLRQFGFWMTPSIFQAFMNISESQVWYYVSHFPKELLNPEVCWQMFNNQQAKGWWWRGWEGPDL